MIIVSYRIGLAVVGALVVGAFDGEAVVGAFEGEAVGAFDGESVATGSQIPRRVHPMLPYVPFGSYPA
jgi:hypothetical protein